MTLLPEQTRALEYARKRGTNASVESIRSRVAATYAEFETMVGALPPDVIREHRSTSAWSVQEVVDHLVESDRPAIDQLAHLLAGRDVDTSIPASLQSQDPQGPMTRDWPTLLREFHAVHQSILDLLASASDDLPLTATAPIQMVVKCAGPDGSLAPVTWEERLDWKAYAILLHAHNREHIAQVQRILSAPPMASATGIPVDA